jgi:hypothetical protein
MISISTLIIHVRPPRAATQISSQVVRRLLGKSLRFPLGGHLKYPIALRQTDSDHPARFRDKLTKVDNRSRFGKPMRFALCEELLSPVSPQFPSDPVKLSETMTNTTAMREMGVHVAGAVIP